MIWRNLNIFVAAFALGQLAIGPLVMLLTYMVTLAGGDVRVGFLFIPVVAIALLVLLAYIWLKRGLAPKFIRPDRHKQHRYGHCILGVGNVLAFAPLVALIILYAIGWQEWRPAYNSDQRLIERVIPWVAPTSLALLVLGFILVFSSRAASSAAGAMQSRRDAA